MDSREAKQVLSHYRPGETDAGDPLMSEALSLAQSDPELAVWFGKHCAAQAKLPGERNLPAAPPARPRPAADVPDDGEHTILFSKPALLLIAAAILVLIIAALAARHAPAPQSTYDNYRNRMGRLVQRAYPMINTDTDPAVIREYLSTNGGAHDFTLPRALEQMPAKGGAILTWNSQPVSLLGFDAGSSTNLFLFLIRRGAFPSPPVLTQTQFTRVGGLMTASWSAGDYLYLLCGPDDIPALKGYLADAP